MKTTRLFFIKEYHPQSILQWTTQFHDDVDNNATTDDISDGDHTLWAHPPRDENVNVNDFDD